MAAASLKGDQAMFALREARGAHRKKLRAMELAKKVGPDMLKIAERKMEEAKNRAVDEGKRLVDACRRGLDGY